MKNFIKILIMACLAHYVPTMPMEEVNTEASEKQSVDFEESLIFILPTELLAELLEMILLKVLFDENACDGCQNIFEALDSIKQKLPNISTSIPLTCKTFNLISKTIYSKEKIYKFYRSLLIEKFLHLIDDNNLIYKEIKKFLITGYDDAIISRIVNPPGFSFNKKEALLGQNLIRLILLLLFYGANINSKNEYGNSALYLTMLQYWDDDTDNSEIKEVFELLLDKGADVNAQDNLWGYGGGTVLHGAISAHSDSGNKIGLIKILLDRGADRTIKDDDGCTAIDLVKESSSYELKELFGCNKREKSGTCFLM